MTSANLVKSIAQKPAEDMTMAVLLKAAAFDVVHHDGIVLSITRKAYRIILKTTYSPSPEILPLPPMYRTSYVLRMYFLFMTCFISYYHDHVIVYLIFDL